jgi:hypothetical protein
MLGMEQMYKMALDPRIFPDSRLLAVLQGKDNSLPMAVAMSAKQQRDKLEQAKAGQQAQMGAKQPTVRDTMLAKDLPQPQAGLDQLPAENMQAMGEPGMAAGGIVAFGMGGFTDPDDDDDDDTTEQDELDSLMARQGDLGGLGAGIMSVANPKAAPYSSIGMQDKGVGALKTGQDSLLDYIMRKESGGRDYDEKGRPLTSNKGAKFAMQVLDSTAKNPGFGIKPAKDVSPEEYNRVGRELVGALHEKYKDPKLAAMAYNWGTGNVDKWLHKGADEKALPKETRMYVASLAQGGVVGFTGGGLNDLLSEFGPEASTMDDAATAGKKPLSKEAAEFLRKQAARSAATAPAATSAIPSAPSISGINKLIGSYLVPGAVYEGGKKLGQATMNTMAGNSYFDDYSDPFMGDVAVGNQILKQNPQALALAQQSAPAAPAKPAPAATPAAAVDNTPVSYDQAKADQGNMGPTRDEMGSSFGPRSSQDLLTQYLSNLEQSRKQAPGLAMMAAGLGIAGQRSPYGLSNIGAGGLQGLQSYEQAQRGDQAGQIAALSAQAAMDRNKVYQQHYAMLGQQGQNVKFSSQMQGINGQIEKEIADSAILKNSPQQAEAYRQRRMPELLKQNPALYNWYQSQGGSTVPSSVQLQNTPGNVIGSVKQ